MGAKGKENGRQIAALPLRRTASGALEVLMVTSRDTGRWVIPKGWTMAKKTPWEAAAIEALEEAGAEGAIARRPIGRYGYVKILADGAGLACQVDVYPMAVAQLNACWKERGERERRWFALEAAAASVDEAELSAILRGLEARPGRLAPLDTALDTASPRETGQG